ncbi:MAG: hypothetical protein ABL886_08205 [Rhodoglobus sp.]
MTLRRPTSLSLAVLAAAAVLVTGCTPAATPGSTPAPLNASVQGQGTVIQMGDSAPEFCLGGIAESYPPQCSGPELVGWNWDTAEGHETVGDVTWGTYAVMGTWDGSRLTVSEAIQLALYDPMPFVDPLLDPEKAGTTAQGDLEAVLGDIVNDSPAEILIAFIENGYVFATVVFDDGSIQAWADATYGAGVVAIRPALRIA